MPGITVSRMINAPVETVFKAVSDIENLPDTAPGILKTEFLSDIKSGVGTRFMETRLIEGKESETILEVTEFAENDHIRLVSDSHGTIWDSIFTVRPSGDQTELILKMDAKGHKLMTKVMNPLFKNMFKKGLEKHLDAIKTYCEKK